MADESSAIKSFDGVRRALVTEFMRKHRYRLLCTATAAPNDYVELGTSSEALGYLGHMDMLGRFFTNRENTAKPIGGRWRPRNGEKWRFKGHAEESFWRWVASWARAMRRPSDLGFPDDGFVLPPLEQHEHYVEARTPQVGRLFDLEASERCELAASLVADADSAVAWCQLNDEGDLLTGLIDGAAQVKGSDSPEQKEETLAAFGRGEIRVLVTKPKIGAWGLNWQHCARMTYFPSHSYEQLYQSVRRSWRFGQSRAVRVDLITTEGGKKALGNLERKAEQAARMFDALVAHMIDAQTIKRFAAYADAVEVPAWLS